MTRPPKRPTDRVDQGSPAGESSHGEQRLADLQRQTREPDLSFELVDPQGASELITLPNVVITPHLGGRAVECGVNATRNAVANAERIARGEEPLWVVDPV